MAAIRPRVAVFNIHSLNHNRAVDSSYFQTASYYGNWYFI